MDKQHLAATDDWRTFIPVVAVVFLSELAVMAGLAHFELGAYPWLETMLDSALVTMIASVISNYLVFKPLAGPRGGGGEIPIEVLILKFGVCIFAAEGGIMLALAVWPLPVAEWLGWVIDAGLLTLIATPTATLWIVHSPGSPATDPTRNRHQVAWIFAKVFVPILVLLSGLVSGGYWSEYTRYREVTRTDERQHLELVHSALQRELLDLGIKLVMLSSQFRTSGLLPATWNREVDQGIIHGLIKFMRAGSEYRSVELWDWECRPFWGGYRERGAVYASRKPESAGVDPICQERVETSTPGQVWITHDLLPTAAEPVVMVAISTALFNRLNERLGGVTLRLPLANVIDRITIHLGELTGEFNLVSQSGEWLYRNDLEAVAESSDDASTSRAGPFSSSFSRIWGELNHPGTEQLTAPEGIFTLVAMGRSPSGRTVEVQSAKGVIDPAVTLPHWWLISRIQWERIAQGSRGFLNTLLLLCLVLVPLLMFGSWNFAKAVWRKRLAEFDLKLHAKELRKERDKLTTIILSAREGILVTNRAGELVIVNPAAERLLGKSATRLIADGFFNFMDDPDFIRSYLEQEGVDMPETVVYNERILNIYAARIVLPEIGEIGSAALIRDVTEEKRLEEELRLLSYTDKLTGLFNRRRMEELLEVEFERSRRYGYNLSVMLFDIDHFKQFNDRYGHDQGDRVLQSLGRVMREHFRKTDYCCRYGGEEFCVILCSTPHSIDSGGYVAADRFRERVAATPVDGLQVTISIGIASYPRAGVTSYSELLKQADQALYRAKRSGRNRVVMAPPPVGGGG